MQLRGAREAVLPGYLRSYVLEDDTKQKWEGDTHTPVAEWYVFEKSLIQEIIADAVKP